MKKMLLLLLLGGLTGCCCRPDPGLLDPCSGWVIPRTPLCYRSLIFDPCRPMRPECSCQCPNGICGPVVHQVQVRHEVYK